MVFCGKPSRGCATCRAKKKKCDAAVPACSLCRRTGSKCPGYRDQLSLSFRDQSQCVIEKVRGSSGKKRHSTDEVAEKSKVSATPDLTHDQRGPEVRISRRFDSRRRSCTSTLEYDELNEALSPLNVDYSPNVDCFWPTLELSPASDPIPFQPKDVHISIIPIALSPPLEEQATYFFFQNYVFTELATPYNHLACLPTICSQVSQMKALSSVIISIGAAGISNIRKDPDIMRAAQEIYSSTLQYTQDLLEDSSQIQKDQTILVVLLLALYENITCCTPQSMRSWSRHVRGATALLSLRGQDSLSDIALLGLFLHLRQQIITDCLQRKAPTPQIVVDWSCKVKGLVSGPKLWENSLEDISIRLCDLRSSIKQGSIDNDEAIRLAATLDEDLEAWLSKVPEYFSYSKIYDFENPEDVFFGCYHVYSETRVVSVWNHYRSLRIITNEVIIDAIYSSGNATSHEVQRRSSEQLLNKLTADICGSVPPFLGYRNGQKNAPVMIGTLLLWPLYTCAAQNYASPVARDWIILQLDKIGEVMGIRLATSLARVLRTRGEVTVWSRIETEEERTLIQEVEWDSCEEW